MQQRWRSLTALTLARVAMGFQFQSVAALAPLFGPDLALDKTQLGWLIGLYLLPGAAVALPGGLLGKRFGDTRAVLAGLVLMTLGGVAMASAQTFAQANAARLVGGIGAVVLNVLVTKMVADCFDGKERLLAMSIMINAWPIGIGLALVVAAPLGATFGWPWGFVASAMLAATGFAFVLALHRVPAPTHVDDRSLAAAMTRSEWRLLLIASLPWLLYNAAFQIALSFLPSFFVDGGMGIAAAASLVALNAAMFVVSVQIGGIVLKRSRHPDRICHAAIAGWCATLGMLAAGSAPLPWIIVGGLVGGLPAAAFVALPAEFLRPQDRNVGMGVFYTVYYLGCAVLPALAGVVYDRSGGAAALVLGAALALLCAPVLWGFRHARRSADVAGGPRVAP